MCCPKFIHAGFDQQKDWIIWETVFLFPNVWLLFRVEWAAETFCSAHFIPPLQKIIWTRVARSCDTLHSVSSLLALYLKPLKHSGRTLSILAWLSWSYDRWGWLLDGDPFIASRDAIVTDVTSAIQTPNSAIETSWKPTVWSTTHFQNHCDFGMVLVQSELASSVWFDIAHSKLPSISRR